MHKGNEDEFDYIDISPDNSPKGLRTPNPISKVNLVSITKNSQEDIISSTQTNLFQNKDNSADENSDIDSLIKSLICRNDEMEFNGNIKKMKDILEEENQILEYLVGKVPICETITDLMDYLEAFFMRGK